MRKLLLHILCIAEVLLGAAEPPPLSEDALEKLSAAGEQCVDEEIKRALLGVKQVMETMEKREERHRGLVEALRRSSDKRKLVRDTEQRLEEAEQQCHYLIKLSFNECQPCLEDTCKAFYASTCRRGFASFSFKVEEFFRNMAARLEAPERVYNRNEENAGRADAPDDGGDPELLQADASFGRLLSAAGLLYNQSAALVQRRQQALGGSFLEAFSAEVRPGSPSSMRGGGGFFGALGLDHVLESVSDFGRNVLEGLSSKVADVFGERQEEETDFRQPDAGAGPLPQSRYLCRGLRRQASDCWQLQSLCEKCEDYLIKECPGVRQLHSETEEMHMLFNATRQQYDERLQLVRRHAEDTQAWLGSMDDKYGWVRHLPDGAGGPRALFSVITVNAQQQLKDMRPKVDSSVVVTILDSGPVTVSVPSGLEVDEPTFIQYVAQEALALRKQQISGIDPVAA
ncbi:clusterin-like protein 1 isoform X2 [Gasterosteus aculeatus]